MAETIAKSCSKGDTMAQLVEEMFRLLSHDTLPRWENGDSWETYLRQLRHSVFIPKLGDPAAKPVPPEEVAAAGSDKLVVQMSTTSKSGLGSSGPYGTQKQTVVLVDHSGHVTFVEKTLYNEHGEYVADKQSDLTFEFDIKNI